MRKTKRILTLLLAAVLLLGCAAMPVSAAGNKYFKDVPVGIWYEKHLNKIMDAQAMMGSYPIIAGYADIYGRPSGYFGPQDPLTRGQFLKMIMEAFSVTGSSIDLSDRSLDSIHWAGRYYRAAEKENLLIADVYISSELLFPCTFAEMEKKISRSEMAVILANLLTNVGMDSVVEINNAEAYINDYSSIGEKYLNAVEQVYGKNLLIGDHLGNFNGSSYLTRAEAVVVIYRFLFEYNFNGDNLADFASRPGQADKVETPSDYVPFAKRWQAMSKAEQNRVLFGDANKTYFYSSADAAPYMTDVTIPIWTMDKTGNKFPSTMTVTVHKEVAKDVALIFQEIYDDPERFPIYGGWSVGGARFTDHMRHNWGVALDINALYNCECYYYHWSGWQQVTCGYGYYPVIEDQSALQTDKRLNGNAARFAGSMSGPSYYSIGGAEGEYGYSVVKAFAKYGWGWGGNGWGINSSGREKFDFMHFSIQANGG